MACFVFDGVDLSTVLDVASVEMPAMPKTSPDVRYASGRDGGLLAGNQLEPLEIKVKARLATDVTDPRDIQRKWAEVSALIRKDSPKPLMLSEGIYRNAVLIGETLLEFKTYSATAELVFLCPDPIAYGATRTVTIPSAGYVYFNVDGSYRAKPRITASAVRDSSSLVWGIRLDEGDFIHIATGSSSARNVVVDCDARTCIVNSSVALPTLDSDWMELEPGTHKLRMDNGAGEATVTFVERWL